MLIVVSVELWKIVCMIYVGFGLNFDLGVC